MSNYITHHTLTVPFDYNRSHFQCRYKSDRIRIQREREFILFPSPPGIRKEDCNLWNWRKKKKKVWKQQNWEKKEESSNMDCKMKILFSVMLSGLVSSAMAINTRTLAFSEAYSPLFGHHNIHRSDDDRHVRLLLDRSSGMILVI